MGAPGTQPRPLAPGRAALALAALLLLLGAPFALGGPWNLSSFQLCRFLFFKEVKDNASGAAYMPETNTLWIVLNNPPRLLEYDTDARMMRRLDTKWLLDPEDVVYISKDRIAVSEEPMEGEIRILDVSEAGAGRQLAAYPANNPRSSGSGNEGLSYNPRSGAFIAAQEKGPKRIVSVRPTAGGGSNWSTLVNGDESFPMLEDLAAVNYIEQLDQLFVLSQESRRLVRSTMDGRVLEQMDVVGSRPEGLAFSPDGKTLSAATPAICCAAYAASASGEGSAPPGGSRRPCAASSPTSSACCAVRRDSAAATWSPILRADVFARIVQIHESASAAAFAPAATAAAATDTAAAGGHQGRGATSEQEARRRGPALALLALLRPPGSVGVPGERGAAAPNEMAVYRSDACRPGEDGWAAAAGKPVGPDPEPKKGGGGGGRGKGGGGGIESRLAQLLK
ncbi:hypothetical protein TSOC_012376 [Tetrabaena socialis]|uniref:Uncharacterized protein n=1 Tax=Tetrabaena socialis TaxID=47790 RepID=A0A2J7ZN80_9CHLO|nr:hypothetical protein TSOC_012376 [Tetrabaena socialis]|eukprot:PNH01725.1 hypothetical protein TSOC_012376 [Tetrabaena socialis]